MANNIVKELNEIKDNYDTEIKDGKNMVEALDGIREAIEQDGEYTSSKDVANAVKDLGVALKEHSGGGSTKLRHIVFSAFQQEDDFEPQEDKVKNNIIAHYDANGVYQLGSLNFGGGVHSIDAYYPTIDNTNIIKFDIVLDPNQSFLIEAPEGVVVEESPGRYEETVYTLTISKDISEPIKITLKNEEL